MHVHCGIVHDVVVSSLGRPKGWRRCAACKPREKVVNVVLVIERHCVVGGHCGRREEKRGGGEREVHCDYTWFGNIDMLTNTSATNIDRNR